MTRRPPPKGYRDDANCNFENFNDEMMGIYDRWCYVLENSPFAKGNEHMYLLTPFGYTTDTQKYRKLREK